VRRCAQARQAGHDYHRGAGDHAALQSLVNSKDFSAAKKRAAQKNSPHFDQRWFGFGKIEHDSARSLKQSTSSEFGGLGNGESIEFTKACLAMVSDRSTAGRRRKLGHVIYSAP